MKNSFIVASMCVSVIAIIAGTFSIMQGNDIEGILYIILSTLWIIIGQVENGK